MAQFKPFKITNAQLANLAKAEGQLIITTDTKKIYLDTSATERVLLNEDIDIVTYQLTKNGSTITLTGSDGSHSIVFKRCTYSCVN